MLVYTDNMTACAYVNQRAPSLSTVGRENIASIGAEHVPGLENMTAAWLSRQQIDQVELMLPLEMFERGHKIWEDGDRPLYDSSQPLDPGVIFQGPMSRVSRHLRPPAALAKGPLVCLPSHTPDPARGGKDMKGNGRVTVDCFTLAQKIVVFRPWRDVQMPIISIANQSGHSQSRPNTTSPARISCLEAEREASTSLGYTDAILSTLLLDRKGSTNKVYNNIWKIFMPWCMGKQINPNRPEYGTCWIFSSAGLRRA